MLISFKNRDDPEYGQVLVRLGLAAFALTFLVIAYAVTGQTENKTAILTGAVFYLLFSAGLVLVRVFAVAPSPTRRILSFTVDTIMITFALTVAGDIGAPLYGGYLWSIIGNGFRYGKRYLYIAQLLSIIGFSFVLIDQPFWHEYPMFGIGLLIWLIIIPPYVSGLISQLEAATANAERANATKSHFLANMSHELRTPLNAIIGYSEILEDEMRDSGHTQHASDLKNIHQSGIHLLGLINEILDLSKIEEGKMDIFSEDIDIHELISDVASTIRPLAEKNANQLKIDVDLNVTTLHTDVTKLRQVLFNLLSNACKFTHNGQITLTVSKRTMMLNKDSEECLAFNVIDDGIGIAADKIESIFLPFQQESLSTNQKFGGTGLGLTISKCFCELMSGKLLINSTQGEGSTFTVMLPLHP